MANRVLNLVCFRFRPDQIEAEQELDQLNEKLLHALNETGKIYLTHTKVKSHYALRMSIGQTNVQERHVEAAWDLIKTMSAKLLVAET